MISQPHPRRLALRPTFDKKLPHGAAWPRHRTLADQFDDLFAAWPPRAGGIVRVLYPLPAWDDHPRSVATGLAGHDLLADVADDARVGPSGTDHLVWDDDSGHT
jgi:hypothetical protein